MNFGYVILGFANGSDAPKFLAIDHSSGGYPYWSTSVNAAKVYATSEEARKVLESSDFRTERSFSGGDTFPPTMVHSGADLSYDRQQGTLKIVVAPLTVGEAAFTEVVFARIKRNECTCTEIQQCRLHKPTYFG